MKTRSLRRAAALLLALALACSLLTLPAAAVGLSNTSLKLKVGEERELSVSDVGDDDGDSVAWSIAAGGESFVTISSDTGLSITVTAVKKGQATILAKVNGRNYTCAVTVTEDPVAVTGVTLNRSSLTMMTGDEEILSATVKPDNASDKSVTWSSDDPNVVTVNNNGRLKAVGAGSTNVTVTTTDGGKIDSCYVTVTRRKGIERLTVSPGSISLSVGDRKTVTVTVEGADVTGEASKDINWTVPAGSPVNMPSLTDSKTGSYTATYTYQVEARPNAAPGSRVTITASSKADSSQYGHCVVTIIDPPAPSVNSVIITGSSTNRYVDPDGTLPLTASISPPDANAAPSWSSDHPEIAKVNSVTGLVTGGKQPGVATITVKAGDRTDSCVVENSGILLSCRPSGGTTQSLTENSVVPIYQYRDITVLAELFGNAKNKRVTLSTSNTSVAGVDDTLRVTANYPGEATITATVEGTGFTARFKVKVSEDVADAITVNIGSNSSYSLSGLMSQLNSRSQSKAGGPLESVSSLKVSTENGVLYYGYTSPESPGHGVGGTERFYYQPAGQGQLALRDVTFVPLPGFNGTAVVDYNGTATNGNTFNGTIRIEAVASGDVSYTTVVNQPVPFAAEHFSAVCVGRNGQAVRYVNFSQPSAGRGTLYYNYSSTGQYSPKVETFTAYYVSSSPSIDDITFVPAENFAGTVDIPYRCTDSSGATFTGTVTVTVHSAGSYTAGDVEYSIGRNQRQSLRVSDFNNFCQRSIGGTLDYIRFTDLPSSTAGILYLNYTSSSSTRVAANRNYYRNYSPYISDISFVPASNYSGTVAIPFTAANTSGVTFSGTLVIHVDDGVGTVHYSTPRNQAVSFYASDFNDASYRINGTSLNRVRFTSLPRSSAGILYLNYSSSSSTRVSTGTNYYRSGTPSLSNITFVPASGYNGTVSIPFTAYDDNGSTFSGTVTIAVGSAGRTIFYSTIPNGVVRFSGADFNSACRNATGDSLNYVRFSPPTSYYGTLYYQYNSSSRTGNSVSSSTNYYYSGSGSRLISDVSFAASSAAGTVSFGYTGYSLRGDSFSGTVEVRVSGSAVVGTSIHYTGSSAPVAFRASDFQNICQMMLGNPLSYVQFTSLPTVGHLNQNYSGPAQTGTGVNSTTHYGTQELDQISYLPKAEYQGTIYIPYTLYDTQGRSHSSSVEIDLSNAYSYSSFSDVSSGYWASPSIEFLRSSGITNGYGNNTYRPGQSISRGEFTLMICRAFQFPTTGSSGFPDVPANSTYAGAVASARNLGIVEGNNGLFQPDRPITRQSAMTMICRAMDAAGQAVPAADASFLSSYVDAGQVSAFARSSVASLIQMGAVQGNSAMRLNPTAPISRAEMAVILHRVLSR